MKVRFSQQSLRIRLRKSEVEALRQHGELEEILLFPGGGRLVTHLLVEVGIEALNAQLDGHSILFHIPADLAHTWYDDDQVGLYATVNCSPWTEKLELILEKDFPCKDRPEENPKDFFEELAKAGDKKC